MEQYISKSALLAEIEWLVNNYDEALDYEAALEDVRDFLDTLEVKEVDLNDEIEKCLKQHNMLAIGKKDFTDIAKHFFELGLKAQKS